MTSSSIGMHGLDTGKASEVLGAAPQHQPRDQRHCFFLHRRNDVRVNCSGRPSRIVVPRAWSGPTGGGLSPAFVVAQAFGTACFGVGFAALRLRTGTIWPLLVLHMLTDLFGQLARLPVTPFLMTQDVVLLAYGLYLVRGGEWSWRVLRARSQTRPPTREPSERRPGPSTCDEASPRVVLPV
jgi:hypothetical protein